MSDHEADHDVWNFEATYCLKPHVWISHAINLRYSAEALVLYDADLIRRLFETKEKQLLPAFFSPNVERMLMGFSLENLLKALILMNPTNARRAFTKEGNLSWGLASHNLCKLAEAADVALSEEEELLLNVLSTCATWAGRYPLPMNEHELPRMRKGAPDRATLSRRRQKERERAWKAGKQLLRPIRDQLHTNIGGQDIDIYRTLFDRLLREIEIRGTHAP